MAVIVASALSLMRDFVREISRRSERSDQVVHDVTRCPSLVAKPFGGYIEIRFRHLGLLCACNHQHNFAPRVCLLIYGRELANAAALELLELFRQLPGDRGVTIGGSRRGQVGESRSDAVASFKDNGCSGRSNDVTDGFGTLFTLALEKPEK